MNKSADRYNDLIKTMREFVAEVLPDGTFRTVNKIFTEDSGYAPEELVGTNFFSYIHSDDLPETLRHCEDLMKKGSFLYSRHYKR